MKKLSGQSEISSRQPVENCWKRIGVWGNEEPRCPKLDEVIHCRNCDVFTQGGRNLLERNLPEEYKNEWTEVMAAKKRRGPPRNRFSGYFSY